MWWVRKYFCEFTLSFTSSYEDTFNTDNLPICTLMPHPRWGGIQQETFEGETFVFCCYS